MVDSYPTELVLDKPIWGSQIGSPQALETIQAMIFIPRKRETCATVVANRYNLFIQYAQLIWQGFLGRRSDRW